MSGILGQLDPAAASWEVLYTAPVDTEVTVKVIVTNRLGSDTTFRCAVSPNGAAISDEQWIAGDKAISGNDTGVTSGFVITGGDVVRVYSGNGNLSFTATGHSRPT